MSVNVKNAAPFEVKTLEEVYQELERQAVENPSILQVRRDGDRAVVHGSVDLQALVRTVVNALAGGP